MLIETVMHREANRNANMILQYEELMSELPNGSIICRKMSIGPVADDKVYRSIRLFETGFLDEEETIKRLKTEVLQDQWAFHTEKILSYLRFVDYREIKWEEEK